jgi:predicted permease
MTDVFIITIPVFIIIALGYTLKGFDIIRPNWVHTLNALVYYVSLPALIIGSLWHIEWLPGLYLFFVYHFIAVLVFGVLLIIFLSLFKLDMRQKAAILLAAVVGNTVYMGFPILSTSVDESLLSVAMGAATVQLVAGLIAAILVVEYLVVRSKRLDIYMADLAQNPLVISLVIGIILSLIEPNQIIRAFDEPVAMLGSTASPLALLMLGAFMHGKFKRMKLGLVSLAITIKLIIFPLIVFWAAQFAGFSAGEQDVSLLISAMPVAVTTFVIAEKYGLDEEFSANTVLLSTVLSAITIPIFLSLVI